MQAHAEFYATAEQLSVQDQQKVDSLEATMRGWVADKSLEIPSIPTVIAEAMRLANDPKATLTEIEQLVNKDQAISGRLVQIANSPLLRGVRDCATIREAVTRIGQQELRMTLFGMFVQTRLFRSRIFGDLMSQLWKHSLAAGSIARLLAEKLGHDPEQAFLAGFLHDVGMPVLLGTLANHHDPESPLNPRVVELAMQRAHEAAGEAVCREWRMPQVVIESVTCHHRFLKAQTNMEMAAIVQISSALTYRFGLGFGQDWLAKYVAQSPDYLPLRDSYRAALAIDMEQYPPFELFSPEAQEILAHVEDYIPRLRAELENPFIAPSRTRSIPPASRQSETASRPARGRTRPMAWIVAAALVATVAAGLLGWYYILNP